jgi:hypothetical protein
VGGKTVGEDLSDRREDTSHCGRPAASPFSGLERSLSARTARSASRVTAAGPLVPWPTSRHLCPAFHPRDRGDSRKGSTRWRASAGRSARSTRAPRVQVAERGKAVREGFIADDNDGVGPLFDWYGNGDVAWSFPGSDGESRSTQASAGFMRSHYRDLAVVVFGRRVFDLTNGWGGKPAPGEHLRRHPSTADGLGACRQRTVHLRRRRR